jgi:hypothetical protein
MRNRATVAKAFVTAASALGFALLTTGTGVNLSWAGSDHAPGLRFTPISFEGVYRTGTKAGKARRFAQACMRFHEECSLPPDMRFPCCAVSTCSPNPGNNGRYWCIGDVK